MDRREAGSNLDESLLSVEGCPLQATCSRRSEADVLITGDVNLCDVNPKGGLRRFDIAEVKYSLQAESASSAVRVQIGILGLDVQGSRFLKMQLLQQM